MHAHSIFTWQASSCFLWMVWVLPLASLTSTLPHQIDPGASQASVTSTTADKLRQQQKSSTIKIVNWNVLYGFNHGRSVDLGVEWIAEQCPDVVALQELNGHTEKSLSALANRWEHPYSVLLKENGFPVGLTSGLPIEVVKRQVDGFHHGYLHCRTHDANFFVVHFWPKKDHEGKQIAGEIRSLIDAGERVVLLGDFNTHSQRDADFLARRSKVNTQFNVVGMFEEIGMIDLVAKHNPNTKFSFPSPITIPRWSKTEQELLAKRQRIDFIFADKELAKGSSSGQIVTSKKVEKISDHYPVIAEIKKRN